MLIFQILDLSKMLLPLAISLSLALFIKLAEPIHPVFDLFVATFEIKLELSVILSELVDLDFNLPNLIHQIIVLIVGTLQLLSKVIHRRTHCRNRGGYFIVVRGVLL